MPGAHVTRPSPTASMPHRSSPAAFTVALALLLAALAAPIQAAETTDPALPASTEFFERRIRPVFAEHCLDCHSPASKTQGGLSLDSRAALLRGGGRGPALVPGKPGQSLLLAAVQHQDPELAMPHRRPALPETAIADLTRWIESGAPWPAEPVEPGSAGTFDLAGRKARLPWLWTAPQRQDPPPPPAGAGAATEIDRFLMARLIEKGLEPSPPAADTTWLRRVWFTLIGLPPSPEAVRAFLDDPTPGRRERVVDGLLASPHFGERWARHWMDLVRYAESRGHESDFAIPNAWQYRDYLIRAYNIDLPYDRFVTEHLAGDLVPPRLNPATGANESVLATGWAFLGEEVHSPVDIRQDECDRVDNKVDVLSKTFLGLTLGCARCHDHKFDAITQRDYYALSGFVLSSRYRQVRFETMEQERQVAAELHALRERHRTRLARASAEALAPAVSLLPSRLAAARRVLAGVTNTQVAAESGIPLTQLTAWTAELEEAGGLTTHPLHALASATRAFRLEEPGPAPFRDHLAKVAATAPTPAEAGAPRVLVDFTRGPGRTPWRTDGPVFGPGPQPAGTLVPGLSPTNPIARVLPYGAALRDPFWNRLSTSPGNESDSGSLPATLQAGRSLHTPTVRLESGRLHYLLRGRARVYAAVDSHIMLAGPLHGALVRGFDGGPEPSWVTHDLSAYAGHRVHVEFAPDGDGEVEVLQVVEAESKPAGFEALRYHPATPPGSFGEWIRGFQEDCGAALRCLANGTFPPDQQRLIPVADWLVRRPALLVEGPTRPEPASVVAEFFREQDALAARLRWTSHTAVGWFDGNGVDEHVLARGKPAKPGEPAPRGLPSAFGLPPLSNPESSGRVALASQIAHPGNPLVARVYVNRVWQHVFGRGIVATPDNFGYLGERPTHPELLDHLAWQFTHEDGWSTKRLLRRLVLTQAFARGSRPAMPRAEEVDPANTLLHRMPVQRLEAEAIRDAILAVSGRLDPRSGGPPVPVHLTDFIIGRGRPGRSGPLDGEGRRSVYTAVPRNFLPTMMLAFDYPTPFSTVGRRNITNVPGQPLTLLNDPFVHEQSRVWANRVIRTLPGATDAARASWMFITAFARPATGEELGLCLAALGEFRELHGPGAEVEAWSDLAHALFNANEFIYLN